MSKSFTNLQLLKLKGRIVTSKTQVNMAMDTKMTTTVSHVFRDIFKSNLTSYNLHTINLHVL